jgi:RNA polymerase sigma-70 factor (ECF subfamily)
VPSGLGHALRPVAEQVALPEFVQDLDASVHQPQSSGQGRAVVVLGDLADSDLAPGSAQAEADRALVRAIAGGSAEALADLYDRHAGIVFGLARRIVSRAEDAEEVVQDVFSQVWRQASRYVNERASVAGWIVMLTRTRAIDRLRARRARPDEDRGEARPQALPIPATGPDPEAITISAEHARKVAAGLAALPDVQRSPLEMAFFEGLTHAEIAARTGVPLGTVKTRIRSAMETLRQTLDVTA